MLTLQTYFHPNEEEVAAKVFDGEAIIINLSSGIYYSIVKVGALVWERMSAGDNLSEMLAEITQRYEVSPERAQSDLEQLMQQLLDEHLVEVSTAPRARTAPGAAPSAKLMYESPRLEIYRDIGHLIALDPPMPGLKDVS